ncbi:MAG: hypothetical protein FWG25_02240 [Promicromonosporaceae bacterium]|nr:hypothetical protein [Promicromonosporaceae bacterium]
MPQRNSKRPNLILPTNDLAFRYLLTAPDHPNVRAAFIRDAFGVVPDRIRVADPYSITKYEALLAEANAASGPTQREEAERRLFDVIRDVRFDIDIADITIEMQVQRDITFLERSLLYLAKMYVGSYGGDHGKIKPAWSLNILRHNWYDDDLPIRFLEFPPVEARQPGVRPLMRWGFFELRKKVEGPMNPWQHFYLTAVARQTDPEPFREAASMMEFINASPKEANVISQLQLREKADRAEQAARDRLFQEKADQRVAEERAATEQRERRAAEHQRKATLTDNIRSARAKGISPEDIADILNVTVAEVDATK